MLIANVGETRNLVFFLTPELGFDSHCEHTAAAVHGVVHRPLSTVNTSVPFASMQELCSALLEYGTVIFNYFKIEVIKLLESVQNSFSRNLLFRRTGFLYDGLPSSQTRNFNRKLSTFEQRRKKSDLILLHKIIVGASGIMSNELLTIRPSLTRGQLLSSLYLKQNSVVEQTS